MKELVWGVYFKVNASAKGAKVRGNGWDNYHDYKELV